MVGPEGFAMPAIALRQDYDAARVRALARASRDARQVRRLLALAAVYDGASRREAAAAGGMDRQILRDWALRFNAEGPDGLIDRQAPGPRPKLTPEQLAAVVRLVEDGQILAIHGVVRWRLIDLTGWIHDEYGVSLDPADWAGSSRRSATDACPPGPDTTPRTRRPWRPSSGIFPLRVQEIRERLPRRTRLEVWFQDEARLDQKNKLTRRWARRGTRPSAPKDQRTQSAYLFGAICPQKGTAAGLVMPYCDTQAMNAHLAEISAQVEPGHHAILLLDQAWWHTSQALETPPNITLLPLPAKAPELNPVENLWQFLRDNRLSSRIFRNYADIVDYCCAAWNTIADQPWRIMSIGLREWAQEY